MKTQSAVLSRPYAHAATGASKALSSTATADVQAGPSRPAIAQDPILFDSTLYEEFRRRNRLKLKQKFKEILEESATLEPAVIPFCEFLTQSLQELECLSEKGKAIDPYFSTFFRLWLGALEKGLDWIHSGAQPAYLTYFADLAALRRDLASEYPQFDDDSVYIQSRVLDDTIRLIPVKDVALSPRFAGRVEDCLPGFPNSDLYRPLDEDGFDLLHEHLSLSLDNLKSLDYSAYLNLKRNIHTIHVTIIRTEKNSMGTRCDCPGSLIAGIQQPRIDRRDTFTTAAQFYHEHCHTKLSLYCQVLDPPFDRADVYVSPFKNENRDIESILHTLYPITAECVISLSLLGAYDELMRQRAIAYLAAVGYRLRLVADIFDSDPISDSSEDFRNLRDLAEHALQTIEDEVQNCPPALRKAHLNERRRVLERHAWDIGQFLCRGLKVRDPGLTKVKARSGRATFTFKGKKYEASLKPGRISRGDYGAYAEPLLSNAWVRNRVANGETISPPVVRIPKSSTLP